MPNVFAGGVLAGLGGRGFHPARGRGLAVRPRQRRKARGRAGGRRPVPPPAALRSSPPATDAAGRNGAKVGLERVRGEGTAASEAAAEPAGAAEAG